MVAVKTGQSATRRSLNPIVLFADDGCPNVQGLEDLSIWEVEPVVRLVVVRPCTAPKSIDIRDPGEAA